MSRFVRPDTKRLTISHGDWLLVKRRLNAGEQRALYTRIASVDPDGTPHVNRFAMGLAAVSGYLLDWSLTDDEGKPVVIRDVSVDQLTATLDALHPEDFEEIRNAIDAHDTAMTAERAVEKNGHDGEKTSSAISPSPDAAAGATSGSPS